MKGIRSVIKDKSRSDLGKEILELKRQLSPPSPEKPEPNRCWVCDWSFNIRKRNDHHSLGKSYDMTIPLCEECHQLLHSDLGRDEIIEFYLKALPEMESLPKGQYRALKLFLLKAAYIMQEVKNGKITGSQKQVLYNDTSPTGETEELGKGQTTLFHI